MRPSSIGSCDGAKPPNNSAAMALTGCAGVPGKAGRRLPGRNDSVGEKWDPPALTGCSTTEVPSRQESVGSAFWRPGIFGRSLPRSSGCLLYTSDAADEEDS